MSSLLTALIFTYPEHGQANMILATSYELALAGVNVHIASFASLRSRVVRLQELLDRHASRPRSIPTGSIIFRECNGVIPYMEAARKHGANIANLPHPYGVLGALEVYSKIGAVLFPWSQEEYLAAIAMVKEIIATTTPDVVGVDQQFFAAQDACRLVGQKFVMMSQTGLKESAVNLQPYLAALWKYPVSVFKSVLDSFGSIHVRPCLVYRRDFHSLSSGGRFPSTSIFTSDSLSNQRPR